MTDQTASALLDVIDVGKSYPDSRGHLVPAVGSVSFSAREGEFVAIVGPSGCGKTTLLRCLAGLQRPDHGSVTFEGDTVSRVPEGFGVVFQEYNRSLFPWLRVQENVEFGLSGLSTREKSERALTALTRVGLADAVEKFPWQLSGGMQQRVAIARALAIHPRVLLMDEPFASVDAQTRINLELMTAEISRELGLTSVLITHDIDEAIFLADRVVVLSSRPSEVITEVVVDLPRPRDEIETKADPRFLEARKLVYDLIVQPVAEQDAASAPGAAV